MHGFRFIMYRLIPRQACLLDLLCAGPGPWVVVIFCWGEGGFEFGPFARNNLLIIIFY